MASFKKVCHGLFSRPGSTLILTGDFNVMSDGYENSKVMMMMTTMMMMMLMMLMMRMMMMQK